ncbi:hypothetical protein ONE63_007650 [Megalurothrips usitatus]|uniref:SSD domain-containing protein n=1 Tax=Megalurothrips usitatus TaxID=439358 RepID=A0AAV7XSK1_9NEOP|nr:hypothetical protein ONE63_007650 [Megalurothrips usitatus]
MDPDVEAVQEEVEMQDLGANQEADEAMIHPADIEGPGAIAAAMTWTIHEKYMVFMNNLQNKFDDHGRRVAQNIHLYVIVIFSILIVAMFGLFRFRQEKNPLHLWIPQDSDFYTDTIWLMNNYGEGVRLQSVLVTAPDVLQPDVMLQLLDIHTKLTNSSGSNTTWKDVCYKVPVITFNIDGPRFRRHVSGIGGVSEAFDAVFNQSFIKEDYRNTRIKLTKDPASVQEMLTDETFDPSLIIGRNLYCTIVKNMPSDCLQQNILDLWKFNRTEIENLTKSQIVNDLNSTTFSPTLGHPTPFKSLLGGITYNANGEIVSAKAILSLYMVHVNFSTVDMDVVGNRGGTADWANGPGLEWESKFVNIMHEACTMNIVQLYYEAGRSFGDISAAGMFQDLDKLMIGIFMMLCYIQLQQTAPNCVESRFFPSMMGLTCVVLAFLTSVALCSLVGIPYGPVHTSLPFLLLGIGVDDMFIILNCWTALPPEHEQKQIPKRMGIAMRHAGLSITLTSATDFFAFVIGSTTVLPSLRSFCIYAAVGVLVTYALQTTLYVAVLAADQHRMDLGRNSFLPWVQQAPPDTVKDHVPQCSPVLKSIYSKIIITKVGKYFTIVIAAVLMAVAVRGNFLVKQDFKPDWFVDQSSYLFQFLQKRDEFFPDFGSSAGVYLGKLHYSEELQNIGSLVEHLNNQSDILKNVDDWWSGFQRYVNFHHMKDIQTDHLADDEFDHYISQYLFSPSGARFQKNFRFSETLECGKPAPKIKVSSIDFYFKKFGSSGEGVKAMRTVKRLVRNANFTTGDRYATVWAKIFANWVTDEIIGAELYRNMGLAFATVGLVTLLFLLCAESSVLVLTCVILTVIDTIGFMYYWGLTIDLVSAIALVLAVGFSVDFAAHIAYAFMDNDGTRDERAIHAVTYIGTAVLHGGLTTLLALSVLSFSHSYIFTAFFKIFFLVICFGIFHGVVFLPVILSILGPVPHSRYLEHIINNPVHVGPPQDHIHDPPDVMELPSPYETPAFDARGL